MHPVVAKLALGGALITAGGLVGVAFAGDPASQGDQPASTAERAPAEVRTQVVHHTVREVRRVKRRPPAIAPATTTATPVMQARAVAPVTRVPTDDRGRGSSDEREHEDELEREDEHDHGRARGRDDEDEHDE